MKKFSIIAVLALSLFAFSLRSIEYALIGSFAPMIFFAGVALLAGSGCVIGGGASRWALRLWGSLLIVYGVIRLGLWVIVTADPSISAHAADTINILHAAMSLLYSIGGCHLIVAPLHTSSSASSTS